MHRSVIPSRLKNICLAVLLAVTALAANAAEITLSREKFNPSDSSDATYGLAGAFIGKIGNQAVFAGGSNFSKGAPWEGGKKQFSDRIYLISGKDGAFQTSSVSDASLPTGLAHGCCATVGHTMFCFGGQNSEGASENVLSISVTNGTATVETTGGLPAGFTPVAALTFKNEIYIHGISAGENSLMKYSPQTRSWKVLTPCPGGPVAAGPVFESQHNGNENAFYLIGGRFEGEEATVVYSDVWEYLPSIDAWSRKGEITLGSETIPIMFAASTPFGSGQILLIGGDTGEELLKRDSLSRALSCALTAADSSAISEQLREAFITNKGFSKRILSYHAITNTWNLLSEADHNLPAVSTAVVFGENIIIPSGETRPGVRSTGIEIITIRENPRSGAVNYLVLFACLIGMLGIGLYFVRKNSTISCKQQIRRNSRFRDRWLRE